jgi:hypothetical protein
LLGYFLSLVLSLIDLALLLRLISISYFGYLTMASDLIDLIDFMLGLISGSFLWGCLGRMVVFLFDPSTFLWSFSVLLWVICQSIPLVFTFGLR